MNYNTRSPVNLRPYFLVYAGYYASYYPGRARTRKEKAAKQNYIVYARKWFGHDLDEALTYLNALQHMFYDFCVITAEYAS